jgi:hypothetical protein
VLKTIPAVPRRLGRRLSGAVGEGLASWLAREPDAAPGLGEGLEGTIEHPWAFQQIQALGDELTIVEVGGGDPGLRLALARAGHRVISVGAPATATLGTVVGLPAGAVAGAAIPEGSVDVLVSINGLDRLPAAAGAEVVEAGRKLLAPGGHVVLTTDGADVSGALAALDAELISADLVQRHGFVALEAGASARGTAAGAVARCFVARKR